MVVPMPRPAFRLRPLKPEELAILEWLVDNGLPADSPYRAQVQDLLVSGVCGCGCPTIELTLPGAQDDPADALNILVDATGEAAAGVHVDLILFSRAARLAELEMYSPAGQDLKDLPDLETLQII